MPAIKPWHMPYEEWYKLHPELKHAVLGLEFDAADLEDLRQAVTDHLRTYRTRVKQACRVSWHRARVYDAIETYNYWRGLTNGAER